GLRRQPGLDRDRDACGDQQGHAHVEAGAGRRAGDPLRGARQAVTVAAPAALLRPNVTFWNIWNMCFGFFGIQFGFQLQNSNVSRIFMTLGADPNSVSALWIAAPLTGLIVQPIIGYLSDRTWTWLGRRRPYFLAGAVLATL